MSPGNFGDDRWRKRVPGQESSRLYKCGKARDIREVTRDWRKFVQEQLPPLNLGGAREAEIAEELAHQLEDRYEELRARGESETEAHAQAAAQFPEWARLAVEIRCARRPVSERLPAAMRNEVLRTMQGEDPPPWQVQGRGRIMGDFLQDVRYAIRSAVKQPGFTAVVLLTLALGIGANTAIFSVLHTVVFKKLPYPDAEQVVMLWQQGRDGKTSNVGYPTFFDWRARSKSFEGMAAMSYWNPTVSTSTGEPEEIDGSFVSEDFFKVLGVAPLLGRTFNAEEDRPNQNNVVIISHGLWQRRFGGDPAVIGKTISLNGYERRIVGVMPATFQSILTYEKLPAEIWRPLGYQGEQAPACRSCQHLRVVGRLRKGTTLQQANVELDTIFANVRREHPNDYASDKVIVEPLQEQFSADSRPVLLVMFGAVGCVLLVACANVAGLMLARSVARQRELAVRTALGARRVRIVRQLLTESSLLALAGGALGIALAAAGIRALVALAPGNIPRLDQVRIDPMALAFALSASLLTGILFGLAPALAASRLDLQGAMKEGGRGSSGRRAGAREALVLADVALALVLLAGAGLMVRSLGQLLRVDPGFNPENVLTMELTVFGPQFYDEKTGRQQTETTYQQILERVRALPGVVAAGAVTQLPLGGDGDMYGLRFKDKPVANPADSPSGDRYCVTPGYLEAMGIRVVRGRSITAEDRAQAQPVILVNEEIAARVWPGEDPLGKFIQMGAESNPWRQVVGVVKTVRHTGLDEADRMQFYAPTAQWEFADSGLKLTVRTAGEPTNLANAVRESIWGVNRNVRIGRVMAMREVVGNSAADRRFAMILLSSFAGMAVLLAAIGLYGLMSYSVTQRTGEIGVRMALGGSPAAMLGMVLRRGMLLTLCGVAVGIAAALALGRTVESMLFAVKPYDPLTLATVALLLCAVAAAACWVPARRAARVDPLVALRYE